MIDRPFLQLTNFKPLIDTCRLFIESKMFLLANTIIDGLIYNSFNINLHQRQHSQQQYLRLEAYQL